MDKKTFAQFLIFSAVVLIGWWTASYILYGRAAARPAPAQRAAGEAAPAGQAIAARPEVRAEGPAGAPPPALVAQPAKPAQVVLANDLISTTWTNRGASLMRFELYAYKAPYKVGDERPVLALLQDFERGLNSDTIQSVTFVGPAAGGQPPVQSTVDTADVYYEVIEQGERKLAFQAVIGDEEGHKLQITKTVALEPGKHDYDVALEFRNVSDLPYEFACALRGAAGIERETAQAEFAGTRVAVSAGNGYKIIKQAPKSLRDGPLTNESTDIAWAAVVNHYFVAVFRPADRQWVANVVSRMVTDTDLLDASGRWGRGTIPKEAQRAYLAQQNCAVIINTARRRLEPGQTLAQGYKFIAAPKLDTVLEPYDAGLPGLIEYGILPVISRWTVALLDAVDSVARNYGVAILIVTIAVRLIMHPLTRKSQLSMSRMQKLQPQIAELQKKHGDDKQKFAQEQWQLMRRYGVSPWGGCLPMLLQMPVLFALFGALRAAIQLRQAGFLWVEDLSRPDTLFYFPLYLPIIGNEFNLLPLLMAAVMVLNQHFTPEPVGEQARQQHKMMKWLPVFMAFLFYHMPSGLSLYFMASTAMGMLERWLIDKQAAKIELKPVAETTPRPRRPGGGPPQAARRTWLDKLTDVQERFQRRGGKGDKPKR